jgi:hypothetical protein
MTADWAQSVTYSGSHTTITSVSTSLHYGLPKKPPRQVLFHNTVLDNNSLISHFEPVDSILCRCAGDASVFWVVCGCRMHLCMSAAMTHHKVSHAELEA